MPTAPFIPALPPSFARVTSPSPSFLVLLPFLGAVVLATGCSSTAPPESTSTDAEPHVEQTQQTAPQIDETPDSLATLPSPQFYRSSTGHRASPEDDVPIRTRLEVVGGIDAKRAQWGLLVRTIGPDTAALGPHPFVDLYGTRIMMRRGQAWRTLQPEGDSLLETRYVPVSPSDVERLARADTMKLGVNGSQFRLPASVRSDLQALNVATPDSLSPDTTSVETLFTAYHDPDVKPDLINELDPNVMGTVVEHLLLGHSQKIRLRLLIHRDGAITPLEVLQEGAPRVVASFVGILQKQTVKPGRHRGQPVPTILTESFTFRSR